MIEVIQREKNFGYISLFTRSGLAIKTFNVTIALVASNFVYYQASWQLRLKAMNMQRGLFHE